VEAEVSEPYVLSNFRVKMYMFKNRLADTDNLQGRWSWNPRRGNKKEKGRSQWEEIKTVFCPFLPTGLNRIPFFSPTPSVS
jgi:hypothetical protein